MGFAAGAGKIWPVPPDWSRPVVERLALGTDIMQASATGVTQHRGLLATPRRGFQFQVLADGQDRRVADMLIAGYGGAYQLPIWPDVQPLLAPLAAGAVEIPCVTAGYDFVAGGKALLYRAVNEFELVDVDAIDTDQVTLAAPTASAFAAGSRLYPVRRARLHDGGDEVLLNHSVSRRTYEFDIDEPCDWPVLSAPTQYLDHMALDVRPDESNNPTAAYARLTQGVDYTVAAPYTYDYPDFAFRRQQSHWKLFGRAEHTWFRSLFYTLDGRRVPIWVPSWASDLTLAAPIAGGSASVSIEWAGYTLFGLGRNNRKDIRIELNDGTVFHRRITAAAELTATETLVLDASLDAGSIAPDQVREISFMALCTLASDSVEIAHMTDADGVATTTTGWQAVVPDV